jgi:hypothetical protein
MMKIRPDIEFIASNVETEASSVEVFPQKPFFI